MPTPVARVEPDSPPTSLESTPAPADSESARLSYKFQRLREQLRRAIQSGEFSGRLPGERDLGRRFNANAKTINKALSDLSAEGLVVRLIGRGTYVALGAAASAPQAPRSFWWVHGGKAPAPQRSLDAGRLFESALKCIKGGGHDSLVAISLADLGWQHEAIRKRSMRETDGVVLCGVTVEDGILSELARRHIPTVTIGVELDALRVESVVADDADAGFRLTEHLFQLGCTRVAVVADETPSAVVDRAYTGCHAACRRRRVRPLERVSPGDLPVWLNQACDGMAGLVVIGSTTARAAALVIQNAASGDRVTWACLPDLGDPIGESLRVTSYDTPTERIAEWAVKLLCDWRPGQPPVQVVVPGKLVIRGECGASAGRETTPSLTEAII